MIKLFPIAVFVVLIQVAAVQAELVEMVVDYKHGDTEMEGFLVFDNAFKGERRGVLIVHQWTGLTDYEKGRARQLAALGYTAFALDIYGKGIRPDRSEAAKYAGIYKGDRALYRERLLAGLGQLRGRAKLDSSKIVAIGYCFGGTGVLELARAGTPLAGVVSFHGGLGAAEGFAARKGGVRAEVLALHGADDPFVPATEVSAFEGEMRAAKANWSLVKYGNAVHAFSQKRASEDPSRGAAYNARADELSWDAMRAFFKRVFKQ